MLSSFPCEVGCSSCSFYILYDFPLKGLGCGLQAFKLVSPPLPRAFLQSLRATLSSFYISVIQQSCVLSNEFIIKQNLSNHVNDFREKKPSYFSLI